MIERETYSSRKPILKTLKIATAAAILTAWAVALAAIVCYGLKVTWQVNPYAVLAPFLMSAAVLLLVWALKTLDEEDIF